MAETPATPTRRRRTSQQRMAAAQQWLNLPRLPSQVQSIRYRRKRSETRELH